MYSDVVGSNGSQEVRPPGSAGYTTPLSVGDQPQEGATSGRVARFLIFCSGADPELLARSGTETAAYVGLGGTVLATASLAVVSSTFFLSMSFSAPWWTMIPLALMWGLIIFNLDRWLLTSYRKLSNQFWTFISLLPRLALAAMIGLLIAEPMVLEIFGAEIAEELRDVEEQTRQERLEEITSGPESRQIEEKRQQIVDLEGRLGQLDDAETASLQAEIDEQRVLLAGWEDEVATARTALLESQASLEEEVIDGCLDGGEGCEPGRGPIARQKEREVELRQQQLDAIEANLNPRIANSSARIAQLQESVDIRREQLSAQIAESDNETNELIRTLRAEIGEIESLMRSLRSGVNDGEIEYGILARIDALETLRERSDNINGIYRLLTIFFIAIDVIPILGKWFMGFGDPRPYELLRDAKERAVEADVAQIFKRHDLDETVRSSASNYLASAQVANDQHLINHWAMIKRNLGQSQLGTWEQSVAPPSYQQVAIDALPAIGVTAELPDLRKKSRIGSSTTGRRAWSKAEIVGLVLLALLLGGLGWFVWTNRVENGDEQTATVGAEDQAPTEADSLSPELAVAREELGAVATDSTTTSQDAAAPSPPDSTTTPSSSIETPTQEPSYLEQLDALRGMIDDPDPARPPYEREAFDENQDLDGDCIRTRHEVLLEEGEDVQVLECRVVSGIWNDGYTGLTITSIDELEVDHVVSLNDAWDSGAWAFSADERRQFSNNTTNLNAIHGPENQRKGNSGPASYEPRRTEQACEYVAQYAAVKAEWGLTITRADFEAIADILADCLPTADALPDN